MIKRKYLEEGGDSGSGGGGDHDYVNPNTGDYATQDDIKNALADQKAQDQKDYAQRGMTANELKGNSLAYNPNNLPQGFTQGFQPQYYQNVATPPGVYGRNNFANNNGNYGGYSGGNSGGNKMPASTNSYGPQGGSGGGKMPASNSAYGPQGGSGGGKMPASNSAYGPQAGGGFRAPPTGYYARGGFADGGETDPMMDTDQGNPYAGQTVGPSDLSWRDSLAGKLMNLTDTSDRAGGSGPSQGWKDTVQGLLGSQGAGRTSASVSDLIPGVSQILGAQEALHEGDYKGAAMSVMPIGGPTGAAAIRMGEGRLMSELAKEGKPTPKPLSDEAMFKMDQMFNKADRDMPAFHDLNKEIAGKFGIEYKEPPLKGIPRSVEKTSFDYNGDPERLKDLVRGTIVVDNPDEAKRVIQALHENHQVESNGYRNLLDPSITPEDGYRDAKMNVKLPSGISGEIQVNYPEILEAKDIAHKLYKERRTIEGKIASQNRDPTPMEDAQIDSYNAQMKQVYDAAYARVLERFERTKALNLPSEMGAPLRRAESGGNGLGAGVSHAVQYDTRPGNGPIVTGMPSTSKNEILPAIGNTSNPTLAGAGAGDNDIVEQALKKIP